MPRGVLISFEGGEASGKTTQIRLLQERLRAAGRSVILVREPGGTPLGEKIRHLLKHDLDGKGMSPETELLLMNASRAELVRKVIGPALDSGAVVLCDRFSDSTLAYQGGGRGLDESMVRSVVRAATGTLHPDLTLWLRLSPAEALRRLRERKGEQGALDDRFDDERSDFFERVERVYEQLAREEPRRFIAVSAEGSPESVASRIWLQVETVLFQIGGGDPARQRKNLTPFCGSSRTAPPVWFGERSLMERLPGFRDFYPEPTPPNEPWSCDFRQHIFRCWRETARRYGFREYDGPPLEPLELYTSKSGAEIVAQLFNFVDKGDRAVAMRPEMTPTVARMVARSERSYRKPIKWFSIPQLFRYEKQQKGRLREHFQLNCDLFGEADVSADSEMVALLIDVLRSLGLTAEDFVVRLSSRQSWLRFLAGTSADPACAYEFFQIVDKIERESPEVTAQKLEALGIRMSEVQAFIDASVPEGEIQTILDDLESRGLREFVRVDYGVIRGLAYYTGVVFEAFDRKGQFRAIAGGGRYDQLVKQVSEGRVDLPALGFGMGDVVLAELLRVRNLAPASPGTVDVLVLIEDESRRKDSLLLVQRLREAGLAVEFSLTPAKGDKQFRRALDLGAGHTARVDGPDGIRVRNLKTREESVAPMDQVVSLLVQAKSP